MSLGFFPFLFFSSRNSFLDWRDGSGDVGVFDSIPKQKLTVTEKMVFPVLALPPRAAQFWPVAASGGKMITCFYGGGKGLRIVP